MLAAFVVALAVGAGITAFVVSRGGGGKAKVAAARVAEFGPTGDATDPLAALSVKFDGKVDRKRIESGLKLQPPVPGAFAWTDTGLAFKPKWPGFAPGTQYQVELNDGKQQLTRWSFKTSGDLAVQFTSPAASDTEVDPQAVIIVQFNRPVAALTALGQQPTQNVLAIDPPVSGSGKWLTSATYRFQPDTGFHASTAYTVRVPHDLTALPGGALPADFSFGFKTVLPAVADEFPRDNTQFVDPGAEVHVLFNQPMDRSSAEAAFSLTNGGARVDGSASWQDDQTLIFKPAAPPARGSTLAATVATGARSKQGTGESAMPFRWSFKTAPSPAVDKTDPANGSNAGATFGVSITFNEPMDHDSTEAAVSIDPAPDKDNQPSFYWGPDTQLRINLALQPSSPYRLTIGAGAQDRFGQAIAAPYVLSFTTAARQPSLTIVSGNFGSLQGTLDAGAPPIVYLATTNVAQASLSLATISASDFRTLTTNSQKRDAFNPAPGSVLRSWSAPIPGQKLNETEVTPIDLSQNLPRGPLQPGFYLLDANAAGQRRTRIALEITHTNIVIKRGADSVLIWAADMASGSPIADATVTIFAGNGDRIAGGVTAADGTFASVIPRPLPNQGTPPLFALLERDADIAMASDAWSGSASPFSFGFPVNVGNQSAFKGYLYFDRPIYRAGETAYFRLILRADNDGAYSLPQNTGAMTVDISDSRGHAVASFPVMLDEFGSMSADVTVPLEGSTGNYNAALNQGGRFIVSSSFLVAEFRAPEFQTDVQTDKPAYTNGATINASVQADLFFGAPLASAAVKWQVNASPYSFRPTDPALAAFSFSDPDAVNAQRPAPKPVASDAGATDAAGHLAFAVPAQLGDFPTSETFTVSATVTDSNQQQVSGSASAIVHKAAIYAGVKPRQYITTAGNPVGFDLLSLDTASKPAANAALHVEAFQRTWTTVKQRDADGSEQYVSTPNDTSVDVRDLSTDAQGKGAYQFTPVKGGQYRVVVTGRDAAGNSFRAATFVYVSASSLLSWRVNNNDKLDLVADKDSYAPGDVAHVLAPAPFAGTTGLVTIERGRVLSHQVQPFSTNSTVIDVPITAEMAPTVYLSVALLKPVTTDTSVAAYRLGYLQLKISPRAHQLNVLLTPDRTKLGPGDTVNVAVKTTDQSGKGVAAELSLAVVDQAVLSLADERNGTLFDSLYGVRPLGMTTGSTLGGSLNVANQAFATQAAGGKGGSGGGNDSGSTDLRRTFQNTAFWQADIKTDGSGSATVAVKLPDNLTTWRINARGVTADTIAGDAGASITTSRDLIVRPVAPRFFTTGDTARLGAIANNQTDTALDVTLTLTGQGVTIKGGAQKVRVPAHGTASAYWDTSAADAATATLTWQAKANSGPADGSELTLPIHDRSTPETVASAGVITSAAAQEQVVVPDYARTDKGQISIELDPSLAAVLKLASGYLEAWPYEPADVTDDRLLDRVGNWQADVKLQRPAADQGSAKDTANLAVARLIGAQSFDGGWSWWSGGTSDPQTTTQVLYALGVARQAGLSVDKNVLSQATRYLTDYYNKPTDALHPADPDGRAFILLALSAAGSGSADRDRALSGQRTVLGGSGKGALLQALLYDGASKDDPAVRALAGDLASSAVASATGTHWEDGASVNGGNATHATSLVEPGLLKLDPEQPLLEGAMRWLSAARVDGHWRTPYETALAVNAVTSFVVARETPATGLTYAVSVNGKPAGAGDFQSGGQQGTVKLDVPLAGLPTNQQIPIDITRQGGGQIYYGLFMSYFTPAEGVSALSNGVTVSREYLPADS
ncbi:MAG: Ig-like domain-containing protein, partial [Dehalococcoidia bacterium]